MKAKHLSIAFGTLLLCSSPAFAAQPHGGETVAAPGQPSTELIQRLMQPITSTTQGSVKIDGRAVRYTAKAGTLVLDGDGLDEGVPQVAMSYVAYFKDGSPASQRPVTFIYNGGPGSSTVWLHMGAFGPHRVVVNDHAHTPSAPYQVVENEYSLLDVSDLVFIDAPGTGFGRLLPRGETDAERMASQEKLAKAYWNVDGDAHAFARFIKIFLSQYDRWNSPKYLFGESYGTTRSAVLANILERQYSVGLNGVMMLSQILNLTLGIHGRDTNHGVVMPFVLALPTYAATAWYHHRLPKYEGANLSKLLNEVVEFSTSDYLSALVAGATLSADKKQAVAQKLHEFTGLPVDYLLKAKLQVNAHMFEQQLLSDTNTTVGHLDTRYVGPSMDPLAKTRSYDPQSGAISSAYVSTYNDYARTKLGFGKGLHFQPNSTEIDGQWTNLHLQPGSDKPETEAFNVMPDLASAMTFNPDLKVKLFGGLYDLSTPFYTAIYEMQHLPIQEHLQKNISYDFYPAGHMFYVYVPSLKKLHDDTAAFIRATDNVH